MISALKQLFTQPDEMDTRSLEEQRNLAAAAMLVEVARADFSQDVEEEAKMAEVLSSALGINPETISELMQDADAAVDQATSLYEFTRLINDHYSYDEKYALIGAMWRVAYADQSLSKYEEHLIRRASELIYLTHEDFIRSKLAARTDND